MEPAEIRVGLQVGEDRHGRVFAYDKVILVSARLGDKVKQSVAVVAVIPTLALHKVNAIASMPNS